MTDLFLGYPDEGITNWIKENYKLDYSKIPLCFEALEDGNIKLIKHNTDVYPDEISLLYSLDNKTWNTWDYITGSDLTVGEKLYLKSSYDNGKFSTNYDVGYNFSTTGKVNVSGNIMSLLYNDFIDKTTLKTVFSRLFNDCTSLIDAANLILPATTEVNCYGNMFQNCKMLTSAPKLSATTLEQYCYLYLFKDCTSLTSVIELPATTLDYECYMQMFENCSNITEIHYPKSIENNSTFTSMPNAPKFGATNATVYYDL